MHCTIRFQCMPFKEVKNGFPVYTLVPEPMFTAWVFIITEITMEFAQKLFHLAGIPHGNRPVSIAMKNINTKWFIIVYQFGHIALVAGTQQDLLRRPTAAVRY